MISHPFYGVLKSASSRRIDCLNSYENNSNKGNENAASFSAKIVIMGAGLIGCEFANDLINAGYQVSVIDPASRPLGALLPEAASEQLRRIVARFRRSVAFWNDRIVSE